MKSIVLLAAFYPFIDVFFISVFGQTRMNDLGGAFFRGLDQVFVRPAVGVFDISMFVFVVGEDVGVDFHAFIAGGAVFAVYPRGHVVTG